MRCIDVRSTVVSQVIASYLDADHFIQTVLERFHVLDCLTLRPNPGSQRSRSFLTQDQEMPMLESFLSFLCMLLTVRTYSGKSLQIIHSFQIFI